MRHFKKRRASLIALGLAISLFAAGCATQNPYDQKPEDQTSSKWYAPVPHDGSSIALSQWWQQFQDPVLTRLVAAAEADSPSLVQAWAAIDRARATMVSSRAKALPSVNAGASATRAKQQLLDGSLGISTKQSASLDASWELDLFGKLRHGTDAAQARWDARIVDWHDARVSLSAEVADTYVQYRGCRLLLDAYTKESASRAATSKSTQAAVRAGFTAPSDGALALAGVANTQSSLIAQQAQCELLIKSLVALTGVAELDLRDWLGTELMEIPQPVGFTVTSIPVQVVRQRPDVASLEFEAAASGSEVGAARADLYPSFSLSGAITVASTNQASSVTTWSFGPSLSLPIFDGGRRRAAVDVAWANYESSIASWRQGVRSAIKEVEQSLVNLDAAAQRAEQARMASEQYGLFLDATEANWRIGRASQLTLEEARRSALSAQIQYIGLQRDRLQHWIALYKALGGGWEAGDPAIEPRNLAKSQINGK